MMHQKVKSPLSHLTNNMTFTVELDRIEPLAADILFRRPIHEDVDWDHPETDAALLMLLVNSLVEDVHRYNDERNAERAKRGVEPVHLCPRCASYTWGRPLNEAREMDFTRRRCHRCNYVYADPEHEDEPEVEKEECRSCGEMSDPKYRNECTKCGEVGCEECMPAGQGSLCKRCQEEEDSLEECSYCGSKVSPECIDECPNCNREGCTNCMPNADTDDCPECQEREGD